MRKNFGIVWLTLLVITAFALAGCEALAGEDDEPDADVIVQTSIAETIAALEIPPEEDLDEEIGPDSSPSATIPATATETLTPTVTLTPTETLTPTPDKPLVHVDVDTNCRTGPGELYDIRGGLLVGKDAEVVGQYSAGDYWVIKNPNGAGECWIWGYYATLQGPLGDLPYYTQPPTPTPVIDWTGTWTTLIGDPGGPYDTVIVTVNQSNSSVTGTFEFNSMSYTMSGSLSADYMTWSGTWDNGSITKPFLWHWLNPNQFNGNTDSGNYAWCGYREGAGQPSPCLYP